MLVDRVDQTLNRLNLSLGNKRNLRSFGGFIVVGLLLFFSMDKVVGNFYFFFDHFIFTNIFPLVVICTQ